MRVLFDFFINIARWAWSESAPLARGTHGLVLRDEIS